jgi:hypothetical protein
MEAVTMKDGSEGAVLARIAKLETDLREIQYVILTKLVGVWLPDTSKRLAELQEDVDAMKGSVRRLPVKDEGRSEIPPELRKYRKHRKYPKNYDNYRRIMEMHEAGVSINGISKALELPYSSVRSYFHLPEDRLAVLKARRDAAERYGIGVAANPPREREVTSP